MYDSLAVVCFPDYHGREVKEELRKEGEFGEELEEDMSVGESTKSTVHVHVDATCMTYACTCTLHVVAQFLQKSV